MSQIKLTLPFPPSVNSLFGGGSNQKRFKSKKYVAWCLSCPKLKPTNLSNVSVTYSFYFPDNRRRDLSNLIKAPEDYLVYQHVIIDDSWQDVNQVTAKGCGIDRKNPRVEIEIG